MSRQGPRAAGTGKVPAAGGPAAPSTDHSKADEEDSMRIVHRLAALIAGACLAAPATVGAAGPFVDVGKQEPITILTPSTPWTGAFTSVVSLYEEQTGNKIKLDVNPFGGVLEKARNDLRAGGGGYDAVMLDTQWTIEMYEGGFLTPFADIEPGYDAPKEVLRYDDSGYWNEQKRWRTSKGGKLMAFTVLGNVPLWYYRTDALKEAGIAPPRTIPEVLASCAKLSKPPATYGAVIRAERGNGIRYEWSQWMVGRGGTVARDPENGDYTVVVNSRENKAALDDFIEVVRKCGAPNPGAIGQNDVIQLLSTGKALQGQLVLAAWANFQDPKKSAVVGKLDVAPIPRAPDGRTGAVIGNWNYAIPKAITPARKKAALAFAKWMMSYDAQIAYAKAGGIPNRVDVLTSDLARDPAYRWMPAYLETLKTAKQELGYLEGPQVEQILGLRLNQAVIGELSSGKALNLAAQEIRDVFDKNKRRTGLLAPLPE
jgi:multiple sugar transport system substrate-binding protein